MNYGFPTYPKGNTEAKPTYLTYRSEWQSDDEHLRYALLSFQMCSKGAPNIMEVMYAFVSFIRMHVL